MKSFGVFLNIITNNRKILQERIAFIRSLGNVGHIELWLEYAGWTDEDSEWLKGELAEFELIMHAPFINITFVADQKEIRDASLAVMKQAFDHARTLAVPAMQRLVSYAKNDFHVSIENLPENSGTMIRYPVTFKEVADMLEKIPELFTTVDLGHRLQNDDPYEKFFSSFTDRIANIHVHNALLNGKAHFGFEEKGDIDLQKFLNLLKKVGYKNYFTFEILGDDTIRSSWDLLQTHLGK